MAIIIAAGLGAVLFTLGAGFVLYSNTRTLTGAAERVQHTQDVLSSLQRASILAERVEYRARLFAFNGDEADLNRARSAANALVTSASHLHSLVADNPNQVANIDALSPPAPIACQIFSPPSPSTRPSRPSRCRPVRRAIGLMSDQEQLLLTERTSHSRDRFLTAISTEFFLIPISILCLLVLFGLILHDAITRHRSALAAEQTNDDLARSILSLEETARESELMTAARNEIQLCVSSCSRSTTQPLSAFPVYCPGPPAAFT